MKLLRAHPAFFAFISILLWQFLLVFQGVDLADTGFHLTAFTYIFKAPYSVQYSMSFYLSEVFGYLWMSIWPMGGLLWARIGWIVPVSISLIIYFSLLNPELGVKKTIIGLGITTIFVLQGGPESVNYDLFTIFGYAITTALLLNGLLKNKPLYLFFAGIALGISFFFRLTNISAIAFVLIIPFWSYVQKKRLFHNPKLLISFIAGLFTGFLLICFQIWAVGHHELFLNNLSFLSTSAGDNRATHDFSHLLSSYLSGYLNAMVMLIIAFIAILLFIKFSAKLRQFAERKLRLIVFIIIAIAISMLMIVFEKPFWSKVRYLFIGFMIFEAILTVFDKKNKEKRRLLAFTGLLLLFVTPLGSDTGLEKSGFGMWILGPMVLTDIKFSTRSRQFKLSITETQAGIIQKLLAILVLTTSVFYAWQSTYYDAGSRAYKTFGIEHAKMKCIYTSKERATALNELIIKGFPEIQKYTYLLSFIETPMLNYLADKEPFISTSWPKLYYSPEAFEEKLNEALEKRKTLPTIIRQKQNTGNEEWPKEQANPQYLNYPEGLSKYPEHGRIMNRFLKKYNYKVVWENGMFQVLLSKKSVTSNALYRKIEIKHLI